MSIHSWTGWGESDVEDLASHRLCRPRMDQTTGICGRDHAPTPVFPRACRRRLGPGEGRETRQMGMLSLPRRLWPESAAIPQRPAQPKVEGEAGLS